MHAKWIPRTWRAHPSRCAIVNTQTFNGASASRNAIHKQPALRKLTRDQHPPGVRRLYAVTGNESARVWLGKLPLIADSDFSHAGTQTRAQSRALTYGAPTGANWFMGIHGKFDLIINELPSFLSAFTCLSLLHSHDDIQWLTASSLSSTWTSQRSANHSAGLSPLLNTFTYRLITRAALLHPFS